MLPVLGIPSVDSSTHSSTAHFPKKQCADSKLGGRHDKPPNELEELKIRQKPIKSSLQAEDQVFMNPDTL